MCFRFKIMLVNKIDENIIVMKFIINVLIELDINK